MTQSIALVIEQSANAQLKGIARDDISGAAVYPGVWSWRHQPSIQIPSDVPMLCPYPKSLSGIVAFPVEQHGLPTNCHHDVYKSVGMRAFKSSGLLHAGLTTSLDLPSSFSTLSNHGKNSMSLSSFLSHSRHQLSCRST